MDYLKNATEGLMKKLLKTPKKNSFVGLVILLSTNFTYANDYNINVCVHYDTPSSSELSINTQLIKRESGNLENELLLSESIVVTKKVGLTCKAMGKIKVSAIPGLKKPDGKIDTSKIRLPSDKFLFAIVDNKSAWSSSCILSIDWRLERDQTNQFWEFKQFGTLTNEGPAEICLAKALCSNAKSIDLDDGSNVYIIFKPQAITTMSSHNFKK